MNKDFFEPIENTRPFLKMALEGFSGTGKSYTAGLIACGLHDMIKSKKPIALYYTERAGIGSIKKFYDDRKKEVISKESRTLADLTQAIKVCEDGLSDILLIDSITHVWERFLPGYKKKFKRDRFQFQDWGVIKPIWKEEFADILVEAKIHILFTGRAGYEYDYFENEEGHKELEKTGIKMKVEGETEYEPDIVVLMEKEKVMDRSKLKQLDRVAFIIKDRNDFIDGCRFKNPTFKDFEPSIRITLMGKSTDKVIEETEDKFTLLDDREYQKKKTKRTILLEEVQGSLVSIFPGATKDEKQIKTDIVNILFKTRSWTAVEKETKMHLLEDAKEILSIWEIKAKRYLETCSGNGTPPDYKEFIEYLDNATTEYKIGITDKPEEKKDQMVDETLELTKPE